MGKLDGKKVAILVADGFEQVEMVKPREALEEAGAETKSFRQTRDKFRECIMPIKATSSMSTYRWTKRERRNSTR